MTKKQRALLCVEALEKEYTDALCSLEASNPLELLIATRLSAQCTDARVNTVTPALFEKYPDAESFAKADIKDVEKLIFSTGFYNTFPLDYPICQHRFVSSPVRWCLPLFRILPTQLRHALPFYLPPSLRNHIPKHRQNVQ